MKLPVLQYTESYDQVHERSGEISIEHPPETDRSVAPNKNYNHVVSQEQNLLRFKIKENLIKQAKQEFELEEQIGARKRKGSAHKHIEEGMDKTRI